jgi:hypothetical protein
MVNPSDAPASEQLALPRLLALFLVPGALMTVVYVVIAPFVEKAGFPPIAAMLVAILIVLVPFELGVILRASQNRPGGKSVRDPLSTIAASPRLAVAGTGPHHRGVHRFRAVDGDRADRYHQPVRLAAGLVRAPHRP